MPRLYIDNYVIDTPLIEIVYDIRNLLTNGKLKDIKIKEHDIQLTCPNDSHDGGAEKNPDCHINLNDDDSDVPFGYFNCFACEAKGPFWHFVALCFSSTDEYAKQWLIKNYGVLAFEKVELADFININKVSRPKYLDKHILDSYQDWCPYLQQRKLSREVCKQFNVKYDPKYRQVIFPIYDENDNLLMLAKRNIDTKFFHMTEDVEKPVYGLSMIKKLNYRKAIITEGPFDCLTGWTYGFPTIATLGAISDEQLESIRKSGINILYTMFDQDQAGEKFTRLIKEKLSDRILIIEVKFPQQYKDLNDLDESTFRQCFKGVINESNSI